MNSCFNYSLLNVVLNGLMGKKNSRDYHFVRFGAVPAGSVRPIQEDIKIALVLPRSLSTGYYSTDD